MDIARLLTHDYRDAADWQAMFALARRLRPLAEGRGPEAFQKAVLAFCELAGKPADDYWLAAFLVCWSKVKLADGDDVVEWGLNRARDQPYLRAASPLEGKLALVASVGYHLADLRKPKPFWFPVKQLASLLNVAEKTVYRAIHLLEMRKVIGCVDPTYSFTGEKKSKEYVFVEKPALKRAGQPAA